MGISVNWYMAFTVNGVSVMSSHDVSIFFLLVGVMSDGLVVYGSSMMDGGVVLGGVAVLVVCVVAVVGDCLVVDRFMDNSRVMDWHLNSDGLVMHYWLVVSSHSLVDDVVLRRVRLMNDGSVMMHRLIFILVVDDSLMGFGGASGGISTLVMLDFVVGVRSCVVCVVRLGRDNLMMHLLRKDRLVMDFLGIDSAVMRGNVAMVTISIVSVVAIHSVAMVTMYNISVRGIIVHFIVIASICVVVTTMHTVMAVSGLDLLSIAVVRLTVILRILVVLGLMGRLVVVSGVIAVVVSMDVAVAVSMIITVADIFVTGRHLSHLMAVLMVTNGLMVFNNSCNNLLRRKDITFHV